MNSQSRTKILRTIYLIGIAMISFFIDVLIEEGWYVVAALVSLVAIGLAILEIMEIPKPKPLMKDTYTLNDWVVKEIISDETTQKIDGRVRQLQGKLNFDAQYQVHMTFHLAIRPFYEKVYNLNFGDMHSDWILVQVIDYVGNRQRGKNRVVSAHKGIIGRSFRIQRPQTTNFDSQERYFDEMTKEFGFFPNEASNHSIDARSYYCLPVALEGGEFPYGILYLYSTRNNFFDTVLLEAIIEDCTTACHDIANFLANDSLVLNARSR